MAGTHQFVRTNQAACEEWKSAARQTRSANRTEVTKNARNRLFVSRLLCTCVDLNINQDWLRERHLHMNLSKVIAKIICEFSFGNNLIFTGLEQQILILFCFGYNLNVVCKESLKEFSFIFLFSLVFSSERSPITTWQFYVCRYVSGGLRAASLPLNPSCLREKRTRS